MANPNNIRGHQARLDFFKRTLPPEKVGSAYVGGAREKVTPAQIGFLEEEALRRHRALENAYVIDLGCGIGRLTSYLLDAGISRYLGTDILPEILTEARNLAAARPEFRFEIVTDCTIPERDGEADIVCAFSLITHLLDEEAFLYFRETARVLKPGGLAVFSFLDFAHWFHQKRWAEYVEGYKAQRDLLKFFEKDTLARFGEMVGLKVVEIIEAGEPFQVSGKRSSLSDGTPAPQSVTSGQSVLFMTKS